MTALSDSEQTPVPGHHHHIDIDFDSIELDYCLCFNFERETTNLHGTLRSTGRTRMHGELYWGILLFQEQNSDRFSSFGIQILNNRPSFATITQQWRKTAGILTFFLLLLSSMRFRSLGIHGIFHTISCALTQNEIQKNSTRLLF